MIVHCISSTLWDGSLSQSQLLFVGGLQKHRRAMSRCTFALGMHVNAITGCKRRPGTPPPLSPPLHLSVRHGMLLAGSLCHKPQLKAASNAISVSRRRTHLVQAEASQPGESSFAVSLSC